MSRCGICNAHTVTNGFWKNCLAAAIVICNALSQSKASKLQELDLQGNHITIKGAESVAAYLAVTAELTKIL